ncbi:MAG: MerR family transcriptional regulator [Acidobacteriota bacterium]|nr:MerR family transcriptional regulator [Acidobacteriota bacterium]
MAAKKQAKKKLYTLSEVSRKTGISVPTLQRYKKAHQDRLPAYGEGRGQRYPDEALEVFRQLRRETDERRGRSPANRARRQKSLGGANSRPVPERREEPLLTLVQIGQMTGISYPTLLRYVRLHIDRLPHVGSGRKRRFHPQAVAVFQELREQSRRGRSTSPSTRREQTASIEKRLERLEAGQRRLATQLRELERVLKRPIKITLQR